MFYFGLFQLFNLALAMKGRFLSTILRANIECLIKIFATTNVIVMNYMNGEMIHNKLSNYNSINRLLMPVSLLSAIINCIVIKLLIILMIAHLKWPALLFVRADWDSWWTYEGISGMFDISFIYLPFFNQLF